MERKTEITIQDEYSIEKKKHIEKKNIKISLSTGTGMFILNDVNEQPNLAIITHAQVWVRNTSESKRCLIINSGLATAM